MFDTTLKAALAELYAIQRELGGGGMALVFLAEDRRHSRQVALKVLRPEFAATLGAERFLREIEVVARLQHPHVLPLLDSGRVPTGRDEERGGLLYFVMPYVEGETLRARLSRTGRMPVAEVVHILSDVADALAYAHGKGIVHRDIKPDNIMLAGRHAVVMDFGVAKAIRAAAVEPKNLTIGVALGTPAYMAPEQATADPQVDHRVDIYALGVVAYELLAGQPPFTGNTPHELLTAHVLDDPDPIEEHRPDVPQPLAELIMKCLAKKPADRWQSASELLARLEPLATPSGGITPTDTRALSGVVPTWRRPGLWSVILTLVVLAVAIVASLRLTGNEAPPDADLRQVTFDGQVLDAAISPDGQFIAYTVAVGDSQEIRLQELRGGDPVRLATISRSLVLTWSADGSEVRYVLRDARGFQLRGIPRLGGAERLLAPTGGFLSPDDKRLAVSTQIGPAVRIFDMERGDSTVYPLPSEYVWAFDASWSPQGDRILVLAERRDGQGWAILTLLLPSGDLVLTAASPNWLSTPVWGKDGRSLAYLEGANGLASLYRLAVDRAGRPRGEPTLLLSGVTVEQRYNNTVHLRGSADGQRLLLVRSDRWSNLALGHLGRPREALRLIPLTTGTAFHSEARFAPDGASVAFVRLESDRATVNVLALDGGGTTTVARADPSSGLTWSPDGSSVAFTMASGHSLVVQSLTPSGPPTVTLAEGKVGHDTWWAAHHGVLVQAVNNRGLLEIHPPADSVAWLPEVPDTVGWAFSPRVSPDGRWLACYWNRGGMPGIWLVSLMGGEARRMDDLPGVGFTSTLSPLNWSGDSRRFFVASTSETGLARLYSVEVPSGRITPLATLPVGTDVEDMTMDGKTALLNRIERRSDAWLVEVGSP